MVIMHRVLMVYFRQLPLIIAWLLMLPDVSWSWQVNFAFELFQATKDGAYLSRHAGIRAGVPIPVAALTVNRMCGSGFQAVVSGAHVGITFSIRLHWLVDCWRIVLIWNYLNMFIWLDDLIHIYDAHVPSSELGVLSPDRGSDFFVSTHCSCTISKCLTNS